MEPERLLDRSIASLRTWLATPLESMFATAEDLRSAPPPPRSSPSEPLANNDVVRVTSACVTWEISAESRSAVIKAMNRPEYALHSLHQESRTLGPTILPIVVIIPTPLTAAEREQLGRQQAAELAYFDRCVLRTRDVLLQLTEEGAHPLWILSILVRYASRAGTVFPSSQVAVLPHSQFTFETPLSWTTPRDAMEPVRLRGHAASSPPSPRRRRGPEGIAVNVGMALLANHFHATTTRHGPHATDISALFRVWGRELSHLNREIVYRRLKRVQSEHATEFQQLALEEACQMTPELAFFERFAPS